MRSVLITLEEKFGRFAIPGLVHILIGLQIVVWLMTLFDGGTGLLASLFFFPPAITYNNEWWRLVSFLVIPSGGGIIWMLFYGPFMWMIADGLEQAWGAFRVNLYVLACVICVDAEGFIHNAPVVSSVPIFLSMVMAYAVYFPDQPINLYGLIPLAMKWIGLMDFGYLVFTFIGGSESIRWHLFASLLPFLVVFGPAIWQYTHHTVKTIDRRQRYTSALRPEDEALHRCSRCGKTERDNPHLDFRVAANGDDVCSECRKA